MSANTSIEWTDRTWNPVRGCSVISPGCINCYAMKQAHRFSGAGKPYDGLTKQTKAGPQWTGVVRMVEGALLEPLSWRKPARVFVNSMSDLFHEDVPDEFIDCVFNVMAYCPQHAFQVLTKRAERMRCYLSAPERMQRVFEGLYNERITERFGHAADEAICRGMDRTEGYDVLPWPLPNVWLGVSCEDQQRADERIPHLLQTPAAVRWVSAEPLLGPILFDQGEYSWLTCHQRCTVDREDTCVSFMNYGHCFNGIDWVVVGGESGPGARPFDLAWARSIVQQCKAADVPCFVKQLGSVPHVGDGGAGWASDFFKGGNRHWRMDDPSTSPLSVYEIRDRKGGDITEWPADLRVREWPRVEVTA